LASRLVHLDFEPDLEDWLAWAEGAGIDPRLRAFLRFRPRLLHAHDPASSEKAFPSPRSWEFASRILAARPHTEAFSALLRGTVGEAAALECMSRTLNSTGRRPARTARLGMVLSEAFRATDSHRA